MLEQIRELFKLDFLYLFIGFILILAVIKSVWTLLEWFIVEKLQIETKSQRERRQEKEKLKATAELAQQTAENLSALESQHTKDEETFRKNLNDYMKESREDRKTLHEEMKQYSENRIADRQQSFQIQKELTDSIKEITKGQCERDGQIAALMEGSKELLGDTIDQRYNKYIALDGIPQNEVDEFDAIYNAYRGLKGNHGRETKYKYVKEHLQVLPVKTEIIKND